MLKKIDIPIFHSALERIITTEGEGEMTIEEFLVSFS